MKPKNTSKEPRDSNIKSPYRIDKEWQLKTKFQYFTQTAQLLINLTRLQTIKFKY